MKQLLIKQINQSLTYEELETIAIRCEAILNSRILTPINENNDVFEFLTPAHFIANGPLFTVPETPVDDKLSLKSRWKYLQQTVQAIWKRWVVEYLNNLTLRHKWKKSIYNPKENQLVYITDINTAPLSYPIGRIVSLHSSSDGVIRSVSIKVNKNNTIIRSVNKLILIPDDAIFD